eukprot:SAG22_NODE_142_length_17922_cov_10.990406_12_plen_251_part_00
MPFRAVPLDQGAPMLSKWLEITAIAPTTPTTTSGGGGLLIDDVTVEILALNCDHATKPAKGGAIGRFDALVTAAHGAAIAWTTDANATNDPGACEPIFSASYSGPPSPPPPPPPPADSSAHVGEHLAHHGHGHSHSHSLDEGRAAGAPPAPPPPPGPPVVIPSAGPAVIVGGSGAGSTRKFVSFRTIELLHDDLDLTRIMLAKHQIYRRLAPWCGGGRPAAALSCFEPLASWLACPSPGGTDRMERHSLR